MAKKALIVTTLIVVVAGAGIYMGFFINAATQMKFEVKDVYIDNVSMGIGTMDVDMRILTNVTNPTDFPLPTIDGGNFQVFINGTYMGPGVFGSFTATKTGALMMVEFNATSSISNILTCFTNYLIGHDIEMRILILSVKIFGITIAINQEQIQLVNLYV
jgi:hypothetical protein